MSATILIVEDHESVRTAIREFLAGRGCTVLETDSWRRAEQMIRAGTPDVAVIDYRVADGDSLELLPRLREAGITLPVVMLTAHGSIDLAVRAIKEGAEQFLTKPVELPALWVLLERIIERERIRRNDAAKHSLRNRDAPDPFVGESAAVRKLADEAGRAGRVSAPVLILGETGVGKGVLARWLHEHGDRGAEPFVNLNCGGLSRELLDSELFGHERGAFTGAVAAKKGLLEVAHRGSLFLDEIGDVDLQVQPKLLKVLEEKTFRRLGEVRDRHVDIRLIAATHQDLIAAQREHRFRRDLYFRISTIQVAIPPLRERTEDIPGLAARVLDELSHALNRGEMTFSAAAIEALVAHSWPGNIRELRNVVERAVLASRSDRVTAQDLRFDPAAGGEGDEGDLTLDELEKRAVLRALARERGRVERAAKRLGIARGSLYNRIRKFGIDMSQF